MQKTLVIIKPNSYKKKVVGKIISMFEDTDDLKIVEMRMAKFTREFAEEFYKMHSKKPFFKKLIDFMTSDYSVVMVIEGENAINRVRDICGATDPAKAAEGTIRKLYADNITENAIHSSDSPENAKEEVQFFMDTFLMRDSYFPKKFFYFTSAHEIVVEVA